MGFREYIRKLENKEDEWVENIKNPKTKIKRYNPEGILQEEGGPILPEEVPLLREMFGAYASTVARGSSATVFGHSAEYTE